MLPEASLRLPIGRNLHFVLLQFPRRRLAFLLMLKLFSTHVSIGSTLSKERLHLIGEFEGEEECSGSPREARGGERPGVILTKLLLMETVLRGLP